VRGSETAPTATPPFSDEEVITEPSSSLSSRSVFLPPFQVAETAAAAAAAAGVAR